MRELRLALQDALAAAAEEITCELAPGSVELRLRGRDPDVAAAERTRVEFAGGRLLIRAPKGWRRYTLRGGGESIAVQIALPTGSHARAEAGIAALRCTGRLGECRCAEARARAGELLDRFGLAEAADRRVST